MDNTYTGRLWIKHQLGTPRNRRWIARVNGVTAITAKGVDLNLLHGRMVKATIGTRYGRQMIIRIELAKQ